MLLGADGAAVRWWRYEPILDNWTGCLCDRRKVRLKRGTAFQDHWFLVGAHWRILPFSSVDLTGTNRRLIIYGGSLNLARALSKLIPDFDFRNPLFNRYRKLMRGSRYRQLVFVEKRDQYRPLNAPDL